MRVFGLKVVLLSLSMVAAYAQAQVINKNNPPEYQSFKYNYSEMIELANENRLPHRIFYKTPSTGENAEWFDAVKQGDLVKVKKMVANGQNIEAKDTGSLDQTALGWAAFIGDEEMVDYLISQNANLWATDKGDVYNVLKSAVLGNNVNVVEKIHNLMKKDVDLNDQTLESDGETLVMVAASNNRLDIVKYLLSQGADINRSTTTDDKTYPSYDQSALTYACKNNLPDMQKLLIANGALNHRTGKPSCDE
ncbi:ankyrin repeat domain-containing protein [Providencia vermicola]|uniref:Ankyrin repeat domain-containing protein n=4 Tax=Providencia TaxID=586 RepID=A0AAI9HZK6_PROST|nr:MULTISPECIES: ankyrin repeat domain-containing protein [Providencia]ELR5035505.1 ankyrin repeat domain-containing protein [Providencia stuartii]ELR5120495.1 ankyrin repeat domain-containing protein [Providencia stuartii]ELX8379025.1 ankyrin repeat domain-containing protein [Providencia stuartii]EMD5258229.1 ankyrin repeat domain-containing protein [Providencia stuartii]USB36702.1 ankyrin repeat domain-containing protein [Providencia vermicola]